VALEIKNAKNFEMDYYAIKALCEKLQEEYPILKSVIFPDPASYDASEFQEEINSYKKMQADILGDPEADYPG